MVTRSMCLGPLYCRCPYQPYPPLTLQVPEEPVLPGDRLQPGGQVPQVLLGGGKTNINPLHKSLS